MIRLQKLLLVAGLVLVAAVAGCSKSSTTTTTAASASPSASPSGKHHSEMSPAELEKWQKDLNIVGCWAGPVDGKMGPETEHAVKQFQTAEKLTVDGLLGPHTESALTKAAGEARKVCGGGTTPTPSRSATATHTAGPSPACAIDLLSAAARTHHGASFKQLHAFECAQPWATASVELTNGSRVQDLFKAGGNAWSWTDRTGPCASGEVPASIRGAACA